MCACASIIIFVCSLHYELANHIISPESRKVQTYA
nr:MAG TPA: hypothetical protein [Caudoviricetes sp.]